MGDGGGGYVSGSEGGVISEMPDKYKKHFLNRHFKKIRKNQKGILPTNTIHDTIHHRRCWEE